MAKKSKTPTLVEIIKANPGCTAKIDNDWWGLYRDSVEGDEEFIHPDEEGYDPDFPESVELATSDTHGGYRGHVYGGAILDALAEIVGINVEGV